MGFLTSTYDVDNYFEKELFDEIKEMVEQNKDFNQLYKSLIKFFEDEELNPEKIPTQLFSAVFKENPELSAITKKFWIKKTWI